MPTHLLRTWMNSGNYFCLGSSSVIKLGVHL